MALPSRPIRKAASVNPSRQATPRTGGVPKPTRRTAQPFGSVSRQSALPTRPVGVSPQSVPVNDKDAGQALKTGKSGANKRGV